MNINLHGLGIDLESLVSTATKAYTTVNPPEAPKAPANVTYTTYTGPAQSMSMATKITLVLAGAGLIGLGVVLLRRKVRRNPHRRSKKHRR